MTRAASFKTCRRRRRAAASAAEIRAASFGTHWSRWSIAALAVTVLAGRAAAQVSERGDQGPPSPVPVWMTQWSPLRPIADVQHTLPAAPALPDLLGPAPRVGLLWTAGTPAGLGLAARDNYTSLDVARQGTSGTYRRPLDAAGYSATQVDGVSWSPLGDHGAVIGRVTGGEAAGDSVAFNDMALPFGTDPFVVTDTVAADMRTVAARLEGGIGGTFGGWSLGAAGGALVESGHSLNSPFPRLATRAQPGVSGGLSRALGGLRLAAFGRWMGGAETVRLPGQPQPGQANILSGYNEPDPIAITLASLFNYRVNVSAWTAGLGAQGRVAGGEWVLSAERTHRHNDHVHARGPSVPVDVWVAGGWTGHGTFQRPMLGGLVTLTAVYDRVSGNGVRADLPGADIYRATDNVLDTRLDWRTASADSTWLVGFVYALRREHESDTDFLVQVTSDVLTLNSGAALEIARRMGRTAVAVGYGVGGYTAATSLPDPTTMGPIFDKITAPALELYGRRALPMTGSVTVERRVGPSTDVRFSARFYRSAATGSQSTLTLVPSGRRTGSELRFGVVMER